MDGRKGDCAPTIKGEGRKQVDFPSIIDPEQLTILAKTFDDYCFVCGITETPARKRLRL